MNADDEVVAQRTEARRLFLESCREMQAKFADVPEDELNALIDEARDYVRHHPE